MRYKKFLPDYIKEHKLIPSTKQMALITCRYFSTNGKVYVIQKDFFEKFSKVNLEDLQWRNLPDNITGFIELPYPIRCCLGSTTQRMFFYAGESLGGQAKEYETNREITIAQIADNEEITITRLFRHLDDTKSVHKAISELVPGDDRTAVSVVYNLLAYLASGDPDIREFKNTIKYKSATSLTPVRADKELSNSDIVQVGFNYMKETLKTADSWEVMPFMRWQRCGKELSEVRLVLVKGHTKKWKNKSDEVMQ